MSASNRIVSLWDMLEINAERFYRTMRSLQVIRSGLNLLIQNRSAEELDVISQQDRYISNDYRADLAQMHYDLIGMGLHLSAITLEKLIEMQDFRPSEPGPPRILPYPTYHIADHAALLDTLSGRIEDELRGRVFLSLSGKEVSAFQDPSPFGDLVDDAFPSIITDIKEAAKCRALERWTASVMHLMRALEVGLAALAAHCGVVHTDNWNKTLNEIEASLRTVRKSVEGKEAEQWAAEAGSHLRFIKNAYRNHAMHPMERYDEERASDIFGNTRSFLRFIASKLAE